MRHGTFEMALDGMKAGAKATRRSWPEGYVFLQHGGKVDGVDDDGSVTPVVFAAYLTRQIDEWTFEPYQPSATDLLADDWECFELSEEPIAYVCTGMVLARHMDSGEASIRLGRRLEPGQPGYLVMSPDGDESWSPAMVFEDTHRRIERWELELLDWVGSTPCDSD